jgi:hypothetical protein
MYLDHSLVSSFLLLRLTLKKYYTDFGQIPSYAVSAIAAATEKRIVVNYPKVWH